MRCCLYLRIPIYMKSRYYFRGCERPLYAQPTLEKYSKTTFEGQPPPPLCVEGRNVVNELRSVSAELCCNFYVLYYAPSSHFKEGSYEVVPMDCNRFVLNFVVKFTFCVLNPLSRYTRKALAGLRPAPPYYELGVFEVI